MGAKQASARGQGPARNERLEARVSADQKVLFQRAAELQGRTLTDFVIASVHEAAMRTLQDMNIVRLSADESRAFAEALLDSREPGARLRDAAQRYLHAGGVDEPTYR